MVEKLPPPPETYKHHCDHQQSLIRWSEVFGLDNINPRLYEKISLVKGDILGDFMYCIGAKITRYMVVPKNANTALSHDALELIRRVNVSNVFARGISAIYRGTLRWTEISHAEEPISAL